jgi:hypothetical protein
MTHSISQRMVLKFMSVDMLRVAPKHTMPKVPLSIMIFSITTLIIMMFNIMMNKIVHSV